jgi:predicted Zn-dependent protease
MPAFLSTHPSPANREQTLRAQAMQLLPTYEAARANGHAPNCRL